MSLQQNKIIPICLSKGVKDLQGKNYGTENQ